MLQRPNKIACRSISTAGARKFIFDGRSLALLDEKQSLYAAIPVRTSLDGLIVLLNEKYGFTPPLAEFAVSDPYAEFHRQGQKVTYLGRARVSGGFLGLGFIECHRLGMKGKAADAELWIGVNDRLPHKLVSTFHREGNPQLRVVFSHWDLAWHATPETFVFTPPKDVEKIELWSVEKMSAVSNP